MVASGGVASGEPDPSGRVAAYWAAAQLAPVPVRCPTESLKYEQSGTTTAGPASTPSPRFSWIASTAAGCQRDRSTSSHPTPWTGGIRVTLVTVGRLAAIPARAASMWPEIPVTVGSWPVGRTWSTTRVGAVPSGVHAEPIGTDHPLPPTPQVAMFWPPEVWRSHSAATTRLSYLPLTYQLVVWEPPRTRVHPAACATGDGETRAARRPKTRAGMLPLRMSR